MKYFDESKNKLQFPSVQVLKVLLYHQTTPLRLFLYVNNHEEKHLGKYKISQCLDPAGVICRLAVNY